MSSPRVFIPQVPSRYDRTINHWVPTVNLEPAKAYGEIDVLLPPEAGRMLPADLHAVLTRALATMSPEDWIVTTGDPLIMAMTMVIAARQLNGLLRILRWDRQSRTYEPIEVQI